MAGTIVPILSTCRLQGRPVEDLLNSPKCFENGKPSLQKLLDTLTREYGWNPITVKKREDIEDWIACALHSIHNDIKDSCEEFVFPHGSKAYVFSYDWDYHNENENIFHVIDVTDDEIVLTGFIPNGNGDFEIYFANRKDLERLYGEGESTLEYIPVATAYHKNMISVEDEKYIRNAIEHCERNGYGHGILKFNKAIVKP